jgi:hypothetical protein
MFKVSSTSNTSLVRVSRGHLLLAVLRLLPLCG